MAKIISMESLTMDELIDIYMKDKHGVYIVLFTSEFTTVIYEHEGKNYIMELCKETGVSWYELLDADIVILKFRNKRKAYSFMKKYKNLTYMKMYVNGKYEDENT
ncbi:MAG: hypothetical protein DRP62_05200 [Planctomycetota bacterium]|nr:MAG: hypothetical protein DRP62_05200 [Planctomycetota bacterium]